MPIVHLQELPGEKYEDASGLDLVFLYGITTLGSAEETRKWPFVVSTLAPKGSTILGCDLKVRLCETSEPASGWKALSDTAGDLLEALYRYSKEKKFMRPMIFICYGLAGWTLKQMLWKATQQFNRFRNIIELISGIVFLATPHITNSSDTASKALALVLRSDLMPNPKLAFNKKDLSYLAYSSLRFEELKVQIPVLSCYETRETKLKAPLWITRKAMLVDKALAETSAPREELVSIDTEFLTIFESTDCVIHLRISNFLDRTLSEASARIQDIFETDYTIAKMAASSVRSASSIADQNDTTDSPSHRPTTISQRRSGSNSQMLSSSFKTESSFEIIPGSSDFTAPRKKVNIPCYFTRPYLSANEGFQGRKEVLEMVDQILTPKASYGPTTGQKELKTFTICGIGGIGKTQIAVEYIFSRRQLFDAIFWFQADDLQKLEAGFVQAAIQLGLEDKETTTDNAASRGLFKSWLADPIQWNSPLDVKQVKWLIVFDNADAPDDIMNHDFWPRDGNGSVLITSRDPMSRSKTFFGDTGVDLYPLTNVDAATLLRSLSNRQFEPDSQRLSLEIAEKLDCFPLAIVQMAGIIQRRNLLLADFIEVYDLETERAELHHLKVGPQSGYSLTLATAWSLEGLSLGAWQILSIAAILDPVCIQEEILVSGSLDPEFTFPGFPIVKSAYFRDLTELTQSSILTRNANQKELSIHRVVQDVVKSKLLQSEEEFITVFKAAVTLLSSQWPFVTKPVIGRPKFQEIDRWDQCEKILPHTIKLRDTFEHINETMQCECATREFAWLLADSAWYHTERSNPAECNHFLDCGFKLLELTNVDLRDILAELHGTRATIASECNDTEAALYHMEQNKALREEEFAKSGVATNKLAAAYSETGKALIMAGLYKKGSELLEESIRIRQDLPGFTRHALYNCLVWLGMVSWQQGDSEKAMELLLGVLRDRELSFGRDDTRGYRTGLLLMHIGTVRGTQNQLEESFSYLQRALLQFRATVGDEHYITAKACYKLSVHYFRHKDYEGAIKFLDQALKIFSRGSYHAPDVARVQFLKSMVLNAMGNNFAADSALRSAWKIRKSIVEGDMRDADALKQEDFDELVSFWSL